MVPRHTVPLRPAPSPVASLGLSALTLVVATLEWLTTPLRVFLRVLLSRTRRAPMSMADEVNALSASVTKAVEGPVAPILRVTNAELIAEMAWTMARSAVGKPPQVIPPAEAGRTFPQSYLVPFHGQPNGYLSTASPAMTERHMEVLFGDDLSVMRHALAESLGTSIRHGVLLDLGSGAGTMLRVLRIHHKRARIFGIELSPYMIAASYAHQLHYLDDHVEVVEANVTQVPFEDGSVRGVTAAFVLHELPEPELKQALKEAVRVLMPGARLSILDVAAPRTLHARARQRVLTRVFHEPYLEAFIELDIGTYLTRMGLTKVEQRDMPRGTALCVYEKPPSPALLN
jgi:ubiquinone/menaquinone biosynthesis C-methylase UbiE